jgi:hypothetical protein
MPDRLAQPQSKMRNGMEEVVGSIPTRSTILTSDYRKRAFAALVHTREWQRALPLFAIIENSLTLECTQGLILLEGARLSPRLSIPGH